MTATTLRPNKYAKACIACGARVESGAGFLVPREGGGWDVICRDEVSAPVDPWAEEQAMAAREYEDRYAPATTLADAHSQWHAVNGRYAVCDLDCGANEGMYDEEAQWSEPEPEVDPLAALAARVKPAPKFRTGVQEETPTVRIGRQEALDVPVVPVASPTAHHIRVQAANGQVYSGMAPGTYTVEYDGYHRTFRIRVQSTDADFAPGKTVIEYLTGSDNTGDYTSFGFVFGSTLKPWRRFQDAHGAYTDLIRDAKEFLRHPENATAARNCIRCNLLLTTPESLASGIGPTCAKRGW